MENNKIAESIDDKLFTVKYKPDTKSHLIPDQEKCKICLNRVCTHICPANVYEWDDVQAKLNVGYENCLECGACRIACTHKCIEWNYPTGSCGVVFKAG